VYEERIRVQEELVKQNPIWY